MSEIKTHLIIKTLAGALIGIMISVMLLFFGSYDHMISDKPFLLAQFLGSCLLGAICNGSSTVYELESWSIGKITLVHYTICMVTFIPCCIFLQWFPVKVLLIVLIIFTVVYFIIWLINFLFWKREVTELNQGLEQLAQKDEKGEQL